MVVKAKCAWCGHEFEYDTRICHGGRKCCSNECSASRIRQQKRLATAKWRMGCIHGRGVSANMLQSAKVRPDGVSEARWRCELRRRESPEYYAVCGDMV